jgi:regulator of protease activity HflC (stomatin/prohibitin superfamily)
LSNLAEFTKSSTLTNEIARTLILFFSFLFLTIVKVVIADIRFPNEAEAIKKVFGAVHAADANEKVLAYQYLQQLPVIANGTASKVWVIPAELSGGIEQIMKAFRK